ncbi:SCP2 sterol-binding domain-containing protein [Neptuniibacter sp. CAU 1671]|uniref:SCP2 sterol-binding domain-containing protein n=1 Tax=Neptuniibacter sp. CAU 1671 TaxID=3032593 RepID=UPI0023DB3D65|nr:SCP2 sterol-binding domain-containing protein [Neptuniibacter sp. CAU 1671]MDF2180837.1 SCP2 sterol-binding domain-containing protein [Neptuniibacter sp. CAU 1671]
MSEALTVSRVVEKLPSRFIPEAANDLEAVFQFKLEDGDDFYIEIHESNCSTSLGNHPDPNVTLLMSAETMFAVISGEKDGMSAFLTGKLRAEGNVMLATRLGKLFSREKRS